MQPTPVASVPTPRELVAASRLCEALIGLLMAYDEGVAPRSTQRAQAALTRQRDTAAKRGSGPNVGTAQGLDRSNDSRSAFVEAGRDGCSNL
jgi:hypothetical protein